MTTFGHKHQIEIYELLLIRKLISMAKYLLLILFINLIYSIFLIAIL